MATATVSYQFTDGTTASGPQVTQNFADIVSFLNNSVIHKDGTKAMTGALLLAAKGTSALHAVTVSQLADGPPLAQMFGQTLTDDLASPTGTYQQWGTEQILIPNPGRKVSLIVTLTGVAISVTGASVHQSTGRVQFSTDNGGSFTNSFDAVNSTVLATISRGSLSASTAIQGVTPSNSIIVRGQLRQDGGSANEVQFNRGYLTCIMFPTP